VHGAMKPIAILASSPARAWLVLALTACGSREQPASTPPPIVPPVAVVDAAIDAAAPVVDADTSVTEVVDAPLGEGTFASLTGVGDITSGFDEADLAEYGPADPAWETISLLGTSVVSLGLPVVSDGYDATLVRTAIKKRFKAIRACYEKHRRTPDLAGEVAIAFTIGRDGKVRSVVARGLDHVDACLATLLRRLQFARHATAATVSYRWTFAPARRE
jgi:hypothetical protein